ncbi:hypothetical protein TNCV_1147431 [Trichonephila clavipes]|nr:hypothetical protein TNCV_1147431 [Trichonephila clavipes]
MTACPGVVTPRVQTINNGPMATCTGHFTAVDLWPRWTSGQGNGVVAGSSRDRASTAEDLPCLFLKNYACELGGHGSLEPACHEFDPSVTEDPLCRGAGARSICRGSNLRGPSPIDLVLLYGATLVNKHSFYLKLASTDK